MVFAHYNNAALSDFVTPEQFGAVGDGVTDDTIPVQAAIDSSVVEVKLTGTYACGNLTIASNKTIFGNGRNATLLMNSGTTGEFVTLTDTGLCEQVVLRDLTIKGVSGEGQVGLYMQATRYCHIENVWIDRFRDSAAPFPTNGTGVGLLLENKTGGFGNSRCEFVNLLIDNSDVGLRMTSVEAAGTACGYHKFHGCNFGLERSAIELLTGLDNGGIYNYFGGLLFQDSISETGDFRENTAVSTGSDATHIELDGGALTTVDIYKGAKLWITNGTGSGQEVEITAYSAGRIATVTPAFSVTPDDTSGFILSKRFHVYCEGVGNTFDGTVHDGSAGVDVMMTNGSQGNSVYNPVAGSVYINMQTTGSRNNLDRRRSGGWGKGSAYVFSNTDYGGDTIISHDSSGLGAASSGGEYRVGTDHSSIHYRWQVSRQDAAARWNFIGSDGGTMMYFYGADEAVKFPKAIFKEATSIALTPAQTSIDVKGHCHLNVTSATVETINEFTTPRANQWLAITTGANVQLEDSATIKLRYPHAGGAETQWLFLSNGSSEYVEFNRVSTADNEIVTPEQFGAVGDGVTDDSAAIQAMLTSSAKSIRFGTKTYVSDANLTSSVAGRTIDLGEGTLLQGDAAATVLLSVSGDNTTVKNGTIQGDGSGTTPIMLQFTGADDCTAHHLTVKDSADMGIQFVTCERPKAHHITCTNNHGGGSSSDSGNLQLSQCSYGQVSDITITESLGKGVSFSGSDDCTADGISVERASYGSDADGCLYITEGSRNRAINIYGKNSHIKISKNTFDTILSDFQIETSGFRPLYLQGAVDVKISNGFVSTSNTPDWGALVINQHPTGPVNPTDITIENVDFTQTGEGDSLVILDANVARAKFKDCKFTSSVAITNYSSADMVSDFGVLTEFENCHMEYTGSGVPDVYGDRAGGVVLRNTTVIQNTASATAAYIRTDDTIISGGYYETNDQYAIRLAGATRFDNVDIVNVNANASGEVGIRMDAGAAGSRIRGCKIDANTGTGIWFTNAGCEDVLIEDCEIDATRTVWIVESTTNRVIGGKLTGLVGLENSGVVSTTVQGSINPGWYVHERSVPFSLASAVVTPEQFGAVGDGVANDEPAFTAAIASLQAGNGGTIQCRAVEYALEDSILIQKDVPIHINGAGDTGDQVGRGESYYGTRFLVNHAGDGFVFGSADLTAGQPRTRFHSLKNCRIKGTATATSGIRFGTPGTDPGDDATSKILIENVYISEFNSTTATQAVYTDTTGFVGACGIFIAKCITSTFRRVRIEFCQYGVGESSSDKTTSLLFHECGIRVNNQWGCKFQSGLTMTFANCVFESNVMGAFLGRSLSGQGGNVSSVTFRDNHSEANLADGGSTLSNDGYARADDGGSFTNYDTEYKDATTNDVAIYPVSPAQDDAFYVGHESGRFTQADFLIGQQGVGTWTVDWEYWNGAWTACPNLSDGTTGFTAATGNRVVTWDYPDDWVRNTVDGTIAFWVRARISAFTSITTQPLVTSGNVVADLFDFMFDDENSGTASDILFIGGSIGVQGQNHGCVGTNNGRAINVRHVALGNADASFPYVRTKNSDVQGNIIQAEVATPHEDRLDLDSNTTFLEARGGLQIGAYGSWADKQNVKWGGVPAWAVNDGRVAFVTGTSSDEELKTYTLPIFDNRSNLFKVIIHGFNAANANTKEIAVQYGGTDIYRRSSTNSGESWRVEVQCRFTNSGTSLLCSGFGQFGTVVDSQRTTVGSTAFGDEAALTIEGVGDASSDVTLSGMEVIILPAEFSAHP